MKRHPLLLAPGLALALAACGGPASEEAQTDETGSNEAVTVAMATTGCLQFFPVYLGLEEGLFADKGVDLTVEKMNGSAAVLQGMLAGQAELGTPGPVPVILSRAQGEDITYVANLKPGGSFALVTPQETGIEDASGLEGMTIGVATADGSEVSFVHSIMAAEGLSESDYEILVVGEGGQAVAGFERDDIDAYAASMDGVATIEYAGIPLTDVTGDATKYIFGNGLAASGDYIAENGQVIEAFGQAYREALELGREDSDAVIEACRQHQPQEVEDPEYAETLLQAVLRSMEQPDGDEFGYMNPDYWQRVFDDATETGEVSEGDVDVDELYTNEFVDSYNEG